MAVKPFDFTKSATKKTTGATSGRTSQIPTLSVLAGTAVQQVTVLPIALLDAHPEQAHYHMDESKLEGLRDSIREKGVLQPICVRAKADGRYEILAGHQRVEASRRVQLQTIPAMVYSGLDDDAATYIFHATNAYGRDGLLPSEKAYAYAEIERVLKKNINGMKTTQAIADETGESTRTIQRYKKLLELSEPLVKMVDNGRISLRAAGVLADLNVNTQNRLAEDLRDNEQQVMTIELAKALVESEKDGQEISLSAQQVANVLRPQKAKKTANTPEQKTRGFKVEIELFADFLPESITKKEAIERITEALRQFNEYSGATTGRT